MPKCHQNIYIFAELNSLHWNKLGKCDQPELMSITLYLNHSSFKCTGELTV